MKKFAVLVCLILFVSCQKNNSKTVKFMALDPGHFHAALTLNTMYEDVDPSINVYAPEGPEVKDFLSKISAYNSRDKNPTDWEVNVSLSDNFLQDMVSKKLGNVMIVAGKNSKKIDYVLAAVKAGFNVYADKPLVINPEGFIKLEEAFKIAKENNVLIYDIMTERFEVTTGLQKAFFMSSEIFGSLINGSEEEPAISKLSVHHFFKYVSGQPLVRPAWFFDINEEGEGIVDVTTHLVDLIQWEAFPNQIIDRSDIEMVNAKRWPTVLLPSEFQKVTGYSYYPPYLSKDLDGENLKVFCNGEMNYKIKGKHAKVSVVWNFKAPEGTKDTHYSIMRGTKSDLIIKQGVEENYKTTLYIKPNEIENFENNLVTALNEIQGKFPGVASTKISDSLWKINVPEELKIGHEAHFGQVTSNFLTYLEKEELPVWEVPNMISKYYTTIEAYKMAQD
ncbi:MAG TPA: oxidoreductase [Flavobacteriaceae bacterium]|nr:oxidoreductase [Flavobacteriaceae bacterium]